MNNQLHTVNSFDYSYVDIIGLNEIQKFVSYYKRVLERKKRARNNIEFKFSSTLIAIDELFYSYLLLYKEDFPNTRIKLKIPYNSTTNKVFQIAKQQIALLNAYYSEKFISINEERHLSLNNVKSNDFMPFVLINEKNGLKIFQSNSDLGLLLSDVSDDDRITLERSSVFNRKDIFYDQLVDVLRKKHQLKLTQLYALKTLSDLSILRHYFINKTKSEKAINSDYRISFFNQRYSDDLKEKIQIKLENGGFFTFSTIQIFIFSLLIKNSKLFNTKHIIGQYANDLNKYISDYESYLEILLNYTKDICFGLEELAKNILEHVEKEGKKGFGVISARIHKKVKIDLLKNNDNVFQKWFDWQGDDFYFLDINVIDSGLKSVKETYISKIEKEIEKYSDKASELYIILKMELEKDLITIRQGYNFNHFLNYREIKLLHQVRRVNARLGLLIFSNLVTDKRNGIIKFSSSTISHPQIDKGYYYNKSIEALETSESDDSDSFIPLGTNYNFIIPIDFTRKDINESSDDPNEGTSTSVLKSLLSYKVIDYNILKQCIANKKTYFVQSLPVRCVVLPIFVIHPTTYLVRNIPVPDISDKYEKIYHYAQMIVQIRNIYKRSITFIDAQKVKRVISSSSDWIRFLAYVQLSYNIDLIIYNIDFDTHQNIIGINKLYDSGEKFWNNLAYTLFYVKYNYTYEERIKVNNQYQSLSLWFCDVLCGKTYREYLTFNRSISNYHHNLYSLVGQDALLFNHDLPNIRNSYLFCNNKLLNFELLIKNESGLSLYEESVSSLLKLEICTLSDSNIESFDKKENFFYKFKGYRISNSHFRLGSKIHISDFYYAKRIFYNSFYANRFAFLVAQYILKELLTNHDRERFISLIGYSRYSELLVSNTRRLLQEQGFININHDIILEDNRVLKNANNIHSEVIFIIPVSSTFSTSDKIKRWLDQILKKHGGGDHSSIRNTDINVLLVADEGFENFNSIQDSNKKEFYKEFGWDHWQDNKPETKILIKNSSNNSQSYQKYFIALTTYWQAIHDCQLCFPVSRMEERCLLETGANSVSPESIFGYPLNRIKIANSKIDYRNYIDTNESLVLRKHIKRENNHYKIYVKSGAFVAKNKTDIQKWLKFIVAPQVYSPSDNITIIAPSQTANSGFVNMVNESIFGGTATVLQYSSTDDILPNFINFNASFFYHSKVFFVDDAMHTGRSFHLINEYVKSISFGGEHYKRFTGCLCVFNRLGYLEELNILNSLVEKGKIYAFTELNIPPIQLTNYDFPDIIKGNLFKNLARDSVSDMMKIHFNELSENIKAYDVDYNSKLPNSDLTHLFDFLVYHAVYNYFSGKFNEKSEFCYNKKDIILFVKDKNKILTHLLEFLTQESNILHFLSSEEGKIFGAELETRLIYICSTPPFSYYKDIKESAFTWIIKKLNNYINTIIQNKDNKSFFDSFFLCIKDGEPVKYCDYQTFKLYLKLAVDLKINYVLSVEMFEAINVLLTYLKASKSHRCSYRKTTKGDKLIPVREKIISPIGFITYYTGLIQQLIYNDEAKAIKLIKNVVECIKLKKISDGEMIYTLRNNFNHPFIHLLSMLVLENTFIFETFQNTFYEEKITELENFTFCDIEKNVNKGKPKKEIFGNFKDILKRYKGQALRSNAVNKMLSKYNIDEGVIYSSDDSGLSEAFDKTIYLKTLLKNESTSRHTEGSIQYKINIILQYLCEILDIDENEMCNGGAFFTLRYKNFNEKEEKISPNDLYTIGTYTTSENHEISTNMITDRSLVFEMYKGIRERGSKKNKSTLELLYNEKNKKYDTILLQNSLNRSLDVNDDYIETRNNQSYNKLFFLKISEIQEDSSHVDELKKVIDMVQKVIEDADNIEKYNYKKILECFSSPEKISSLKNDESTEAEFIKSIDKIQNQELKSHIFEEVINSISQPDLAPIQILENIKNLLLEKKYKSTFKANPQAVICFYKCCRKEQCCYAKNCSMKNRRFDPKRIRFLLLIRDDIRKFINNQLDNDSLRAFIEMDIRSKMFGNIEHSNNLYIEYAKRLIDECQNDKLGVNLQRAIFLISSRYKLQKVYYNHLRSQDELKDVLDACEIHEGVYAFNDLFELFKEYLLNLCKNSDRLAKDLIVKIIPGNGVDSKYVSHEGVLEEILFEAALNISEHVKNKEEMKIDNLNQLNILFKEDNNESDIYIVIENNLAIKNTQLKKNMNYEKSSHGLSIIYKYSKLLYEREADCEYVESDVENDLLFRLKIPVKKI